MYVYLCVSVCFVSVFLFMCVCLSSCVCVHVCMCERVCACVCLCSPVCVRVHACMGVHFRVHIGALPIIQQIWGGVDFKYLCMWLREREGTLQFLQQVVHSTNH